MRAAGGFNNLGMHFGLRAGLLWRQFGWPPVLGITLLLAAAVLHGQLTPTLNAELAALEAQNLAFARPRPTPQVNPASAPAKPASLLTERKQVFERTLISSSAVPETLARLFAAAAAAKVTLAQGDYRTTTEKVGAYAALRIVLPVKSSYPQLRSFVDSALAQNPAIALEEISFKREAVGASMGEARVRLVVYVRDTGQLAGTAAPLIEVPPSAPPTETKVATP